MDFTCAFIKSTSNFLLKDFSPDKETTSKTIHCDEISNFDIDAIFLDENIENESLSIFQKEAIYTPIGIASNFNLNADNFNSIDYNISKANFLKIHESWLLSNNLTLIKEIFKITTHLKNLWPNNRTEFFEELWFTIKTNIGASNLKIIYNDLNDLKNKKDLTQVCIQGTKIPNTTPAEDIEKILLDNYKSSSIDLFSICEYNKEKGELVAQAIINQSPILIIANIFQLNALQKNLLSSLFDGIQTININ